MQQQKRKAHELGDLGMELTIIGMGGHGRNREEMLLHFTLLLSAALAMASFYFTSSYSTMLWIYSGGVVGGVVIAVPDYAYFNRSPLRWSQPMGTDAAAVTQAMARVKRPAHSSVHRLAASSSSASASASACTSSEDTPFRLSSFPCFPTSAMYHRAASSGGRR